MPGMVGLRVGAGLREWTVLEDPECEEDRAKAMGRADCRWDGLQF